MQVENITWETVLQKIHYFRALDLTEQVRLHELHIIPKAPCLAPPRDAIFCHNNTNNRHVRHPNNTNLSNLPRHNKCNPSAILPQLSLLNDTHFKCSLRLWGAWRASCSSTLG